MRVSFNQEKGHLTMPLLGCMWVRNNAQSPKENLDVVTIPGCIGTSEADEAAAAAAAAIGEVSK